MQKHQGVYDHDNFDAESNADSIYEEYDSIPKNYHNDETSFDNNMAHMRRIYKYLEGNGKGATQWLSMIENSFPEAKKADEKDKTVWQFNTDKIWELILKNEKWRQKMEKRKINSYGQLSEYIFDAQN